ncbi:MAG TPA: gliding motility-associated C-terminal domain-containing protein [Ohtaekwangia sp.]|uniref:T9SS type B sorting domain-containing protein n=1 Tax=Ohtaekwangia sp. TaxID=2066019 RepID=UPI002F92E1D2
MFRSILYSFLFFTILLSNPFTSRSLYAQCVGLPTVSSLGSNKFPAGFCSPVSARVTYNVGFLSAVPAGSVDIYIDWGDGTNSTIPQTPGQTSYSADVTHTFPVNSDCEFVVVMTIKYKGSLCPITRQVQRIASWRTDEFNGGKVQLISPLTGTTEHQVCAGVDLSVVFQDLTNWNCNPNYVHPPGPDAVESPNIANRWQQIIYNTGSTGSKIPNLKVDGIPVTGAGGADILTSYQDTRGVYYMNTPTVVANNRRPSLQITAPGGFGAGYPQVGDVFQITIRYWNFCNPYSNDTANPLVPVNGDLINGDNAPVERTATIRVVSAPPAPTASADQTVCYNTTPSNFSISGVPSGYIVNWYKNVAGATDSPGALISSGTSTSLSIKSHPNWVDNKTPGIYKVWASYQPNAANGLNCESPKVMIKRTIREDINLPDPISTIPTEVCNSTATSPTTVTVTMPPTTIETIGGATQYVWTGSSGVSVASTTAVSGTFSFNVNFSAGQLYVDRTISVRKQYATSPTCFKEKTYTIRVYNPSVGGTLSSAPDVCQTSPVGNITLSGNIGAVTRWEVSFNGGAFNTDASLGTGTTISPGILPPGIYKFRAVVDNGPCNEANSSEEQVEVSTNPGLPANAGADQFVCQLTGATLDSQPLGASDPSPGTGTWSYISSVPTGLPSPTFSPDKNDRNAYISIPATDAGAYTLRWTVTSGTCSSYDDVVVDFGTDPTDPNAGNDKQVCGTTTSLEGNTPTIGTGSWSVVSGPGGCTGSGCPISITNTRTPTSAIALTGSPYTYGAYTLRWTITSGGAACFQKSDDVVITFDEPPLINSAPDVSSTCIDPNNLTPINLTGTINGGAVSGQWQNVSGSGTISPVSTSGSNPITINATYTPVMDDYDLGADIRVKLVALAASSSSCSSVEQQAVIHIDRKPVANAGSDIPDICDSSVKLNADAPAYGATGKWTTGVAGVTFDDNTNPQATASGLTAAPGSVVVTWTLTSASGNCVSDPSSITLTRAPLPSAISFTATECEESPAGVPVVANILLTDYEDQVTTLSAANREITWYKDSAPPAGTQITDPTVEQTGVTTGQVYIARIRDVSASCTNDATVTINVRALPTAKDATVALCEDVAGSNTVSNVDLSDAAYVNEVTGSASNVTVAWFPSLFDAQNNTFEITSPVDVTSSAKYYARVRFTDTPSCEDYAELTLVVKSTPTSDQIFGRESVCQGNSSVEIYQVTPVTGAKYTWKIPNDPATQYKVFGGGTSNDFFVLLQFPNLLSDTISVQVELNGCSGTVIKKPIAVSPTPIKPTILGDSVVCENDEGITYNVSPNNYPSSSYNWEIHKASDNSLGGAFISNGQATNQILLNFLEDDIIIHVQESNSICVSEMSTYTVQVNKRPIMLDGDADICSNYPVGVKFEADPSSPVSIDQYNITNTSYATEIVPIVGPTHGNGVSADTIRNDQFQNIKAVPLPVNYTVVPVNIDANGKECPGDAQIITLTIKPEPQLHPSLDKELCSGVSTGIALVSASNTFPADKFIIEAITVPSSITALTTIQTPDATTQYNSDAISNHQWENTAGADSTVIYTIRPYSTLLGCSGTSKQIHVTIHPKTVVDTIANKISCNNDLLNVALTSANNSDATFFWTVKSSDSYISAATSAGQGDIQNLLLQNSKSVDGIITFQVQGKNTATEGNCSGPAREFTVTVKPSPQADDVSKTVCSDTPGGNTYTANLKALESSVTPNASDANTKITWYKSQTLNPTDEIPSASLSAYVMQDQVAVYAVVEYIPTGCRKTATITYTVNPSVSFTATPVDLLCNGQSNGEIKVSVTNGTPSYAFKIDNGLFVNSSTDPYIFTSLSGGNYTVTVQDSKGCTASQSVAVFEPTALTATISLAKAISCYQQRDGAIRATVTGGTAPYTEYRLVQSNVPDDNNDGLFENLGIGSYNIRVKDTNGCFATTDMLALDQPAPVEINTVKVAADDAGYNLTCKDATDGEVYVTFTGGTTSTAGYTAMLVNVADTKDTTDVTGINNATFTALGKGTYSIVVKDTMGCVSRSAGATILNPPALNGGSIGVDQSICLDSDAAKISELSEPFGGVENYQYQWQQSRTGDDNDWIDIPASAGGQINEYDPGVLPETTYFRRLVWSVSTRTGKHCEVKGTDVRERVTVTVNQPPSVQVSGPSNLCYGKAGRITLSVVSGAIPILYSYTDGTNSVVNEEGGNTNIIVVPEIQQNTTYQFYDISDANGCTASNTPEELQVSINVINVSTDFSIVGPDAQCPGNDFTFKWNVVPDVKYEWVWSRDSSTVFPADSLSSGDHTIQHGFAAGSPDNSTVYNVKLKASNFLCTPDPTSREITIYPLIALNVLPGDTTLCSGQTIRFEDQSLGIDHGKWYYHVLNTTDVLGETPAPAAEVEYTMTNNTTQNPITYEVVYEAANNEGCSGTYKKQVVVYRGVTAGLSAGTVPPFSGGVSTVTFTNTSDPIDTNDFDYSWDFDDVKASPSTANGTGPYTVEYHAAGTKHVSLKVNNIAARDAGETCADTKTVTINILLPAVHAAFSVTPLAACFPTNLEVTNLSPSADTFLWELYNNNVMVDSSSVRNPTFRVSEPGSYSIYLKAGFAASGQSDSTTVRGIEVFDVPTASFELRPSIVYIPDMEAQTFNFSTHANQYTWDFDDGTTSTDFEPKHIYTLEGKYTVSLLAGYDNGEKDIDGDGVTDGHLVCYDSAQYPITAIQGGSVKIPNAFTPNTSGSSHGSGVPGSGTFNDTFQPIVSGAEEFTMQIFDRWGNLLFESQDQNKGWDGYDRNGRLMPAGVYVYKLVIRLSNGQRTTKVGDITLIR